MQCKFTHLALNKCGSLVICENDCKVYMWIYLENFVVVVVSNKFSE